MKNEKYFSKKRGLPWLLRQIFLLITYPFRHWLLSLFILIVLAALYCVPVFWYRVPKNEVFDWYKGKFVQLQQIKINKDTEKKGTDELVYTESPAVSVVGRKEFGQVEGAGIQPVDVLSQEADDVVEVVSVVDDASETISSEVIKTEAVVEAKQEEIVKVVEHSEPEKAKFIYKKGEYTELNYLNEPEKIEGIATIINANELMIDDTYVFLYGIYVSPKTEKGVKTLVMLKNLLNKKKIVCNVLAYTKADNTATAECFADGESINQFLIDKGYSEKVATK